MRGLNCARLPAAHSSSLVVPTALPWGVWSARGHRAVVCSTYTCHIVFTYLSTQRCDTARECRGPLFVTRFSTRLGEIARIWNRAHALGFEDFGLFWSLQHCLSPFWVFSIFSLFFVSPLMIFSLLIFFRFCCLCLSLFRVLSIYFWSFLDYFFRFCLVSVDCWSFRDCLSRFCFSFGRLWVSSGLFVSILF